MAKVPVTVLGMGGASIGDMYVKISNAQAVQTLEAAHAHGVTFFDTSPWYGVGLSEARFGIALHSVPRDSFFLQTKVGRYLTPSDPNKINRGAFKGGLNLAPILDYSYDGVMKSFEQSLNRLCVEYIDIALIHDLDPFTHGKLTQDYFKIAIKGAYKALKKLKEQGLIKAIGVGLQDVSMCIQFSKAEDFDCMLLANRYTLLEQNSISNFFSIAKEKNISILLAGIFNSGILVKGLVKGVTYEYSPVNPEIKKKYLKLEQICNYFKIPVAAAALQFSYTPEVVSTLILGMDQPNQIKENLDLLNFKIDPDFWINLKKNNIINPDCPTPI